MNKIDARSKTIRELLSGAKYAIDYYQREYKWETRQIVELLEDLESKFLSSYTEGDERYTVEKYAHYFLGSIVISHKDGQNFIIDGQQRLTSLTLLLIFLNNLQQGRPDQVEVRPLIFSEKFGKKSFNLDVPERTPCLEALFNRQLFDPTDKPESVRNIYGRYADIEDLFPDSLREEVLPFFMDWLLENVHLVEITAYSDDDAYTIFETMNDRGLSLSPTEMLKGYLLANIHDTNEKIHAHDIWKKRITQLQELGPEEEADFFKAWLRAKYAQTMREKKEGAINKDWEKIATSYHKWVRESEIPLKDSATFRDFVERQFDRYAQHHLRIRRAAQTFTPGLEYVFYNAHHEFTLQYPLLLAPLRPSDDQDTIDRKIRLVAGFLDIFIARRAVNYRTLGYSSIKYTMFNLVKDIRNLDVPTLAAYLKQRVAELPESFNGMARFGLNQWSRRYIHHILARITYHIEQQSGFPSHFPDYVDRSLKKPFEIEHLWADKFERHNKEFASPEEFQEHRNRIGGLVLLPRGFNQSLNDGTYADKVGHYYAQNLLARSLHPQCYTNNPSFMQYKQRSGHPFQAYPDTFSKDDLAERQKLYQAICEEIWSPTRFDRELI